jgi:hypothetical protein
VRKGHCPATSSVAFSSRSSEQKYTAAWLDPKGGRKEMAIERLRLPEAAVVRSRERDRERVMRNVSVETFIDPTSLSLPPSLCLFYLFPNIAVMELPGVGKQCGHSTCTSVGKSNKISSALLRTPTVCFVTLSLSLSLSSVGNGLFGKTFCRSNAPTAIKSIGK